jgi:tartrate dehydratase beta subunit/fumarate hydratase class I family protein
MTNEHRLQLPVSEEQISQLKLGDIVYLSGLVHTMRDMGHRRA